MPGSTTTPDRTEACADAPARFAFHRGHSVGVRVNGSFAAQCPGLCVPLPTLRPHPYGWPDARLGANVDRYSFIAVDLHHLLLAGLPAHSLEPRTTPMQISDGNSPRLGLCDPGGASSEVRRPSRR